MVNLSKLLEKRKISSRHLAVLIYAGAYNYWLLRKEKAEAFFNSNSVENCIKYKELFNEVLKNLDITRESLEILLERKLTEEELKGIKLV